MSVVESEEMLQVLPPHAGRGAGGQQVGEVQGGAHVAAQLEVDVDNSLLLLSGRQTKY